MSNPIANITGVVPWSIPVFASTIDEFFNQLYYPIKLTYDQFIDLYWKINNINFDFTGTTRYGIIGNDGPPYYNTICNISQGDGGSYVQSNVGLIWQDGSLIPSIDMPINESLGRRACEISWKIDDSLERPSASFGSFNIKNYLMYNPLGAEKVIAIPNGSCPSELSNNPTCYDFYPFFYVFYQIGGYVRYSSTLLPVPDGFPYPLGKTGINVYIDNSKVGSFNLGAEVTDYNIFCDRQLFFEAGDYKINLRCPSQTCLYSSSSSSSSSSSLSLTPIVKISDVSPPFLVIKKTESTCELYGHANIDLKYNSNNLLNNNIYGTVAVTNASAPATVINGKFWFSFPTITRTPNMDPLITQDATISIQNANLYYLDIEYTETGILYKEIPLQLGFDNNTIFYNLYRYCPCTNMSDPCSSMDGVSFNTVPPPIIGGLDAPNTLNFGLVSQSGFRLYWNSVFGASGYRVYIAEDSKFLFTLQNYNGTYIDETSIDITGLNSGKNYFAKIRSANPFGLSPYSNTFVQTTAPYGYIEMEQNGTINNDDFTLQGYIIINTGNGEFRSVGSTGYYKKVFYASNASWESFSNDLKLYYSGGIDIDEPNGSWSPNPFTNLTFSASNTLSKRFTMDTSPPTNLFTRSAKLIQINDIKSGDLQLVYADKLNKGHFLGPARLNTVEFYGLTAQDTISFYTNSTGNIKTSLFTQAWQWDGSFWVPGGYSIRGIINIINRRFSGII